MKINWKYCVRLFAALALGAAPAHAVMNGLGQDIFPVAAVFFSSVTVVDARGVGANQVRLADNIIVSSEANAGLGGGVRVSTNVYVVGFSSASKYYGDGTALSGVITVVNLYSNGHNSIDCMNNYGILRKTTNGYLCQFTGSSCPGGWTRLNNFGITHPRHGGTLCGDCVTGSHEFADIGLESCTHGVADGEGNCTQTSAPVYTVLVAVGCY